MIFLKKIVFCSVFVLSYQLFFIQVHSNTVEHLYLDLMKKTLLNTIYQDSNARGAFNKNGNNTYSKKERENGQDWPLMAHTMIGLKRLNNIQFCVEDVLKNNIPGDLIETGVWRGGATIFMRAILKTYQITDRNVWVADSFEGLPKPNQTLYPVDKGDKLHKIKFLAVSLDEVKSNFQKYDLLDNQVKFLKGWFSESLPNAPIKKLALLRLDGDMYESTMDALKALYHKVSPGGYIIIDDWTLKGAHKAVLGFRRQQNIKDKIHPIGDKMSAYWKKTK